LANDIECPEIYGDPAMLIPQYYMPKNEKKYRLGIIPHLVDLISVLSKYSNIEGVKVINLSDGVESVCDQICECEQIISSALHGIIVSHAYGIPAGWCEFSGNVLGNGFKFEDYETTIDGLTKVAEADILTAKIEPTKRIVSMFDLMQVCPL
jgi:hypothetical protein